MLLRKHNQSLPATLAALVATSLCVVGCGALTRRASGSLQGSTAGGSLRAPPTLSGVPLGSHDVAAAPLPGSTLKGSLLLTLEGEPGSTLRYSLEPFAADASAASLSSYGAPVSLVPPVTVYAQAEVGGQRGPVRTFSYDFDPAFRPPLPAVTQRRLPYPVGTPLPLPAAAELTAFAPAGLGERLASVVTLDGKAGGWSGQGPLALLGGSGAVPESFAYLDLSWAQAGETDDTLYAVLATRAAPRSANGTTYGFELGSSLVTVHTFGPGVHFLYHVEVGEKGQLTVTTPATKATVTLSPASRAVIGDVVEVALAKSDLPLLAGVGDLTFQPFSEDTTTGTDLFERLEPTILRSSFELWRGVVPAPEGGRSWQLDFRADPALGADALAAPYVTLGSAILPELERMNSLRIQQQGTLPLWFVDKDENGYAGLNTTDRGVLVTLGPGASQLAKAQLLAHELAHFQNARGSQLKPRWLQEGMSEWSAERFLYRHFPARAVHGYLQTLRFDRFFDGLAGGADNFPLAKWGTEPSVLGYEKSLMFLDLLEARVGQAALVKAFQLAVNESLDSDGFRRVLEAQSGQDLGKLWVGWVEAGAYDPSADPAKLFKDDDQDGLMGLDEELLGTDPALLDSRGDGYPDGEAYYRGMDLKTSAIDPGGALAGQRVTVLVDRDATESTPLFRLGGAKGATHAFSLDPFSQAPEESYTYPQLLRPPYRVVTQATLGASAGSLQSFTRDLWVGGVKQAVSFDPQWILPPSPVASLTLATGLTQASGIGRGGTDLVLASPPGDLPDFLAAYDLTAVTAQATAQAVTVSLTTRQPADPYGAWGDYVLTFLTLDWSSAGPGLVQAGAFSLSAGSPYWHAFQGGTEQVTRMDSGVTWGSAGSVLTVALDPSRLASWLGDPGEHLVCAETQLSLEGGNRFHDHAGCITLTSPGFTRAVSSTADHFGLAPHSVELFLDTPHATSARLTHLTSLGATALGAFERALGRPLWERHHYPVHLTLGASGSPTTGSAAVDSGSYLYVPVDYEQDERLDYLFVEQLARQVMADVLDRSGESAPFWIQEVFIQWLASSALYRVYPTTLVHDFHTLRLDDYACYLAGTPACQGFFAGDVPLASWNVGSLNSTGSVKALAFTLELDALIGAPAVAQALGTFANRIPDEATLKALLTGFAGPAKAAALAALWARFVDGTASPSTDKTQIYQSLYPITSDNLFQFEATKLGCGTNSCPTYLQ